jgi:ATP-binding cassette subfamily C (CFTR/MRP) protein 1
MLIELVSISYFQLMVHKCPLNNDISVTGSADDSVFIGLGFEVINDAWAAPIEIAIAMWLLQRALGAAFFMPIILTVACLLVIMRITPLFGIAVGGWNKGVEERVSFTSAVLGNMKEVKLLGLTDRWSADIQAYRVEELELSKKARIFSVYRFALCKYPCSVPNPFNLGLVLTKITVRVSIFLTPAATFGVFLLIAAKHGEHLSVATVFTSLSLLSLLSNPLGYLFSALPQCSMALTCFGRIQAFLAEDDRENGIDKHSRSASKEFSSSMLNLTKEIEPNTLSPYQTQRIGQDTPMLTLRDVSFGTKEEGAPITQKLNMEVFRSTLTIIIGKVGSGKSTLLKGLLREIPSSTGSVEYKFSESAYCEQEPWLVNGTIQNNILGQSTLEARWYETVVAACALDKDFAALPMGDLSLIGSKGISLSGGQKARVVSFDLAHVVIADLAGTSTSPILETGRRHYRRCAERPRLDDRGVCLGERLRVTRNLSPAWHDCCACYTQSTPPSGSRQYCGPR